MAMKSYDSWPTKFAAVFPTRRPRQLCIIISAVILSLLVVAFGLQIREGTSWRVLRPWATDVDTIPFAPPVTPGQHWTTNGGSTRLPKIHIVIPVSESNPKLCKNLLSQTILGYDRPDLLMWGQQFNNEHFLGKGSHLGKISSTLEWLEDPKHKQYDDDLVVMIDAYDIWFQLPPETLVSRFYEAIAAEDARIAHRMGRAASIERIRTKVVFSASKRCGPNDIHSFACFPVPESALPEDVYGNITDTKKGPNPFAGFRQKHLVSGFIMGTGRDMRPIFQRANEKMKKCLDGEMKGEKFIRAWCHKGSDQSFLNEMYGEQEFHREEMRIHHHTWLDKVLDRWFPNRAGAPRKPIRIEHLVVDNPLGPSWDHLPMPDPGYKPDQPYEFGIMVDHFSALSHQTSNALWDSAFVVHSKPLQPQIDNPSHGQKIICDPKAPMPTDIPVVGPLDLFPYVDRPTWEDLPLYSEVCSGVVPVIAHHNWNEKWPLDKLWPDMWWTGYARLLLGERRKRGDGKMVGGADTDTGDSLTWDDLCPKEWDKDIFVEKRRS